MTEDTKSGWTSGKGWTYGMLALVMVTLIAIIVWQLVSTSWTAMAIYISAAIGIIALAAAMFFVWRLANRGDHFSDQGIANEAAKRAYSGNFKDTLSRSLDIPAENLEKTPRGYESSEVAAAPRRTNGERRSREEMFR